MQSDARPSGTCSLAVPVCISLLLPCSFVMAQATCPSLGLALLLKYGGVWLDATTLMTHSLESLLGDDLAVRTFFSLPPIWEDQALRGNASWIQRSDPIYHGPWIIAITAPLILRIPVWVGKIMPTTGSWNRHRVISSCDVSRIVLGSFWMERGNPAGAAGVVRRCRLFVCWFFAEMFSEVSRHNLRLTGMFTPQQLEIMNRLGIRTYLSSDACIFRTVLAVSGIWNFNLGMLTIGHKRFAMRFEPFEPTSLPSFFRTIFEDRALWNWFHSDRVRIHSPLGKLGFGWMASWCSWSNTLLWNSGCSGLNLGATLQICWSCLDDSPITHNSVGGILYILSGYDLGSVRRCQGNMTHLGDRIFNRVDHELAEEFINDRDLFMKYTSAMRQVRHIPSSTRAYDCCDVFCFLVVFFELSLPFSSVLHFSRPKKDVGRRWCFPSIPRPFGAWRTPFVWSWTPLALTPRHAARPQRCHWLLRPKVNAWEKKGAARLLPRENRGMRKKLNIAKKERY